MKMRFVENAIFHTSELVPYDVALKGKEVIAKWKSDKVYWIVPGIVVAHRDNPAQKIHVEMILRKSFEVENGILDDKTRQPIKERKSKIEGVRCHFWEPIE